MSIDDLVELGNLALTQGRIAAAVNFYSQALELEPTNTNIKENLGGALVHLGLAQTGHDLLCDLTSPTALSNKGLALARLNRYAESVAVLRDALVQNQAPTTAVNLALSLLSLGQYDEGFALFEARLFSDNTIPPWEARWSGTDTATLVVMHEQGFGDTLMMARYFPFLLEKTTTCYLAVPPPLNALLKHSFPKHIVVSDPAELPAQFQWCYTMSLPHLFGTTQTNIPLNIPYLKSVNQPLPNPSQRRRVGYCYSGGQRANEALIALDAVRSIPRDRFNEFISLSPDVDWISLQHQDPVSFKDFAETAALIDTLDLVISVDTSVFHLAAAMGKPTWLLDRYNTCWRHRTAQWYPQVRRFTQPTFDDWETPLMHLHQDLRY